MKGTKIAEDREDGIHGGRASSVGGKRRQTGDGTMVTDTPKSYPRVTTSGGTKLRAATADRPNPQQEATYPAPRATASEQTRQRQSEKMAEQRAMHLCPRSKRPWQCCFGLERGRERSGVGRGR